MLVLMTDVTLARPPAFEYAGQLDYLDFLRGTPEDKLDIEIRTDLSNDFMRSYPPGPIKDIYVQVFKAMNLDNIYVTRMQYDPDARVISIWAYTISKALASDFAYQIGRGPFDNYGLANISWLNNNGLYEAEIRLYETL